MQYELRTQVIEPIRKTFTHLVERYGDRPASRYEEGTIGLQATEHFHYRPLWAPDKELYDPAYSRLVLTDPYSFTDPRQLYYAPYVTARSQLHEAFGKTLDYLESHNLLARLPEAWQQLLTGLVLPLRHYESGGQMISSNACRFAYGTTIAQCAGYAAFDRVGNAQILSRIGLALGGGTTDALTEAKAAWMDAPALQGLRRYVEEAMVAGDWGVEMVALDLADQLLYAVLYRHLDEVALLGGAGSYSLLAQHLAGWFADQRRWVDALYKAWAADPETGAANVEHLGSVAAEWLPKAQAAVGQLAAAIDELVPDAGAVGAVDAAAASVTASLAALGVSAAASAHSKEESA